MRPCIVDEHVGAARHRRPSGPGRRFRSTSPTRSARMRWPMRTGRKGVFVALGGLHVTSLPDEAAAHADAIFLGPGEQTFPRFLDDFRAGQPLRRYVSTVGPDVGSRAADPARSDPSAARIWCRTRSSSRAGVRSIATSATRTRSSRAADRSTPSASTTRSPRSIGCLDAISTSSTITCLATAALPPRCSTACAA